jgi:AmmeMemoRadiSam system protein B
MDSQSKNLMEYPKIRPVEAIPTVLDGKRVIMLRDVSSLSDKVIFVSPELLFLISQMNGENRILDIQVAYTRNFGTIITSEKIKEILNQLDEALFLESERFYKYLENMKEEFKKSNIRKTYLAGKSYPDEKEILKNYLNIFFQNIEVGKKKNVLGIISPHIDYQRGGNCYAYAYSELEDIEENSTFVILGTSHFFQGDDLLILTKKDFETPLGVLKNDKEFIEKIEKKLNKDLCKEEFAHKNEHSIELQTVFLKYILKEKNFKIFPILCGSFSRFIEKEITPKNDSEIIDFISAFKEVKNELSYKIYFIAGADLAHIGLNFGDKTPVNSLVAEETKKKDLEMLKFVENLDAEGFYNYILSERDNRRICGLSPIYLLLNLIEARKCKILKYDFWFDRNSGSLVSFASLGFYSD